MNEDIYQLYLDEIERVLPCTPADNADLAALLACGDKGVKDRLVEGNLKAVLTYVREYRNRGILSADLIQEANMALVLAVESYGTLVSAMMTEHEAAPVRPEEGVFERYLEQKIREALESAVGQQAAEAKAEEEVLARVNVLKEVTQRMAEELGREATLEELAEKMKMRVEEIKDIMKLTLDAMSVTGE